MGLVACGHAAPAPAPAPAPPGPPGPPGPDDEVVCARYGYQVLLSAADDVTVFAQRDYDAAIAAKDDRAAAQHFLDCARRFALVPGDDGLYQAHVCYYDAIYAFANANALDHGGRDAMLAAAAADPRNADYIKTELAGITDCR